MTRLLIRSDRLVIRSDECPTSFINCIAQAPPQARTRLAAHRAGAAGLVDRDLQTLWASKLPLHRWTGTWAETIFVHQSAWWPPAKGLRPKQRLSASRAIDRQLSQAARSTRRDLRDQCRASATTRGPWIDRYGSGPRRSRLCQGGRHPRRHGRILSCCQRPAVRLGGAR
jgi:hypothetical protein